SRKLLKPPGIRSPRSPVGDRHELILAQKLGVTRAADPCRAPVTRNNSGAEAARRQNRGACSVLLICNGGLPGRAVRIFRRSVGDCMNPRNAQDERPSGLREEAGSTVTRWISALKQGDQTAASGLWESYYRRLVG